MTSHSRNKIVVRHTDIRDSATHLLTAFRDKQHYFRHATLPITRIITASWLYARSIPRRSVKPVNPHGDPYKSPRCARSARSRRPFPARVKAANADVGKSAILHDAFIHGHRDWDTIWILDARVIATVVSLDGERRINVRARARRKKRADGRQKYYADKIFMVIGTRDRDRLYFPRWIEMVPSSPTRGTQILPFSSRRRRQKKSGAGLICHCRLCARIIIGVYLSLFSAVKNCWWLVPVIRG